MPKYVIEREIPGAGALTAEQLHEIANRSCAALREMDGRAQWLHSYVTDDKIYCVYYGKNEDAIIEHARRGGFPADVIARVSTIIDLTTAEDASLPQPA